MTGNRFSKDLINIQKEGIKINYTSLWQKQL